MRHFFTTKSGDQQTISTEYETIRGWETPLINDAEVVLDAGTGAMKLKRGIWELSFAISNEQTTGGVGYAAMYRATIDGEALRGAVQRFAPAPQGEFAPVLRLSAMFRAREGQTLSLQHKTESAAGAQSVIAEGTSISLRRIHDGY